MNSVTDTGFTSSWHVIAKAALPIHLPNRTHRGRRGGSTLTIMNSNVLPTANSLARPNVGTLRLDGSIFTRYRLSAYLNVLEFKSHFL